MGHFDSTITGPFSPTAVRKTSVSVAPSMVMQAVEPSSRMELIMVVVCQ
jgi:hypothetical protein